MKYPKAKKQFFEFLGRNYHKRVLAAAGIVMQKIEEAASLNNKTQYEIKENEVLNGAKNWRNYSEGGCALCANEDIKNTYYLDAFDVDQYLAIQGDLLSKAWHEWELFKYYRNLY